MKYRNIVKLEKFNHVLLGGIANVSSGGTPSRARPDFWEGNIPWIKTSQIHNSKINECDVEEYITRAGLENSSAKIVVQGTVLMAMYGQGKTRGKVAILNFDASINQACAAILLSEECDRHFIFQSLLSKYNQIRAMSNTGGQENLSIGIIKTILVPLPPLPEQKAIASVLECWDKTIQKYEEKIDKKKNIKKGLMQKLLSGEQRLPGFDEKWDSRKLEDFCERVTRKNTLKCKRILTISGNLGLIDQREYYERRIASKDSSNYYLIKNGEFAYNRSRSKGYPFGAIKRLEYFTEGVVSTLYTCFWIINEIAFSNYAAFLFESSEIYKSLYSVCCEGSRSHGLLNITVTDFLSIRVNLPPLPEQKAIASILSSADSETKALEKKLALLRDQKKYLLNNLVTGTIRLPEFCKVVG